MLKDAYTEAKSLLGENRDAMDKIADFLIEKETITGKEFMKIFRKVKGIPEPEEEKKEEKISRIYGDAQGQPTYAGQVPVPGQPPYSGPGQPPSQGQAPSQGQPYYPGQTPGPGQPYVPGQLNGLQGQAPYQSQPFGQEQAANQDQKAAGTNGDRSENGGNL